MVRNNAVSLVKLVFFAILAFGLTFGNFVLEGRAAKDESIVEQKISSINFTENSKIYPRGIMRVEDENTKIEVLNSSEEGEYLFELQKGRLWSNFSISEAKVNVKVGKIVVIPNMAQFSLLYEDQKLIMDVYGGDVYIGFLAEGVDLQEFVDPYDPIFINTLLIPQDSRASVTMSKVDDRIGEILHSKLVKEFQYTAIPSSEKESDWVKLNLSKDRKYLESKKQDYIAKTLQEGLRGSDGIIADFLFWSEENLTFMPERKKEVMFDHLFAYLDDAIYYANKGDNQESDLLMRLFNDYLLSLPADFQQSEAFLNRLDVYIDDLMIFSYQSRQNEILSQLLKSKFEAKQNQIEIVNIAWLNVYDAMKQGKSEAESALDNYYRYFDVARKDKDLDSDFYKKFITYQNELFDNLFLRFSIFYKDGYFAIKSAMEKELLSLYLEGQQKEELRQTLISNKFDFLKRIIRSFFRDEMEVEETKEILSRLIGEIRDLMPADSSGVAVIQLFENQLNDIAYVWGYLNSPEYYTSKTYGATHEERYQSYLRERDKIWSFIDIQEEVLGEKLVSDVKIVDIEKAISEYFYANPEVSDVSFGEIQDVGQRYVKVNGVIGGYPFEAQYDRDYQLLEEVYGYGEIVSQQAVKLDNLLVLLQKKFANVSDKQKEKYEDLNEETNAQRIARNYIAGLVEDAGFEVFEEQVRIVDGESAIYRVENVYLRDYPKNKVTFDYRPSSERAENVILYIEEETIVLDDQYTLEQLPDLLRSGGPQTSAAKLKR